MAHATARRFVPLALYLLIASLLLLSTVSAVHAYDYPVHPYTPGSYEGRTFFFDSNHLGEDIDLAEGTPIEAIGSGTIKFYGPASGYGELVVVVEHDLGANFTFTNAYGNPVTTRYILSIYGHLRDSAVRGGTGTALQVGDPVTESTTVGYVNDDANNGDGAEHLHMGVRLSDAATAIANDPTAWFRGYEGATTFGTDFAAASDVLALLGAGSVEHIWSRAFGSGATDEGNDVSVAPDGSAIITGFAAGTVDFGGGPLGGGGGFVVKLSSDGAHVWSQRFGTSSGDAGIGAFATSDGGALVTGRQGNNIVVLKLASDGSHIWNRSFSGGRGLGVCEASDGGVLVTGQFAGTLDFGGGPLVPVGSNDIFVLKLASDGSHLWSRGFGGVGNDFGIGVSPTADGGVVVTGYFLDTVDFGGGPLVSAGAEDVFVLRLASGGSHVWSRRFGGTGEDGGGRVATTADLGFAVAGFFGSTVDFGGGPLTSAGFDDIFVLKLGSDGSHVWSSGYGSPASQERGLSVSATSDGGVLVAAAFQGTVDFGGGPLTSAGGNDDVVLRLAADGSHVWSKRFGGAGGDAAYGVSAAPDGGAIVTGTFSGTVDFGGGALTSAGGNDIFALGLGPGVIVVGINDKPPSASGGLSITSYPNPFNPTTTIRYSIAQSAFVQLRIYDVSGRLLQTLVNERKTAGEHRTSWDGRDASGASVASGIYFLRLEFAGLLQTRKIVLLK